MPKPENIVKHQWKPGQSGNPKGGPKGKMLTTLLKEILEADTYEYIDDARIILENGKLGEKVKVRIKRPNKETLMKAVVKHATKGNSPYMREIMQRLEGKLEQPVRHIEDLDVSVTYWDIHGVDGQDPEADNNNNDDTNE